MSIFSEFVNVKSVKNRKTRASSLTGKTRARINCVPVSISNSFMSEKSTSFLKLRKYRLIFERRRKPQKSFEARLFLYVITKFLSVGGSKDPLDLLQDAGVDMSSPQPIDDALSVFEEYLEQLAKVLGLIQNRKAQGE